MRDLIVLVKENECDIYVGEKNKCQQIERVCENKLCETIGDIYKYGDKVHIYTDVVETRLKVFTKSFWENALNDVPHSWYFGEKLNELFFGDDIDCDEYVFDYQFERETEDDVSVSCARMKKSAIERYIIMSSEYNYRITTLAPYDNFRRDFKKYFSGKCN